MTRKRAPHLSVNAEQHGRRIDRMLADRFCSVPFANIQKWLRTGQIRVDGKRIAPSHRLATGEQIRLPPFAAVPSAPPSQADKPPAISTTQKRALIARILYRDDDLLILDKPAGLAVQGGSGLTHHLDAMLDALRFGSSQKPRLVHRLDKEVGGTLVLARHRKAAALLTRMFRERHVRKLYLALTETRPRRKEGWIIQRTSDEPVRVLARHAPATPPSESYAETHFRTIAAAENQQALVLLSPVSGRKHQLRLHMAQLGSPILGDRKYGSRKTPPPKHLFLFAHRICLPATETTPRIKATAPLPSWFSTCLSAHWSDAEQQISAAVSDA